MKKEKRLPFGMRIVVHAHTHIPIEGLLNRLQTFQYETTGYETTVKNACVSVCARARVRVCVRVHACACVHARVHARMQARVLVRVHVRACMETYTLGFGEAKVQQWDSVGSTVAT